MKDSFPPQTHVLTAHTPMPESQYVLLLNQSMHVSQQGQPQDYVNSLRAAKQAVVFQTGIFLI
jgi:hypothetical protein